MEAWIPDSCLGDLEGKWLAFETLAQAASLGVSFSCKRSFLVDLSLAEKS